MGTDMWTVVGRLRPKAQQDVEPRNDQAEFAFFGDKKVNFTDFEFYSGDETNLGRNYRLFEWLGDNEFGAYASLITPLPNPGIRHGVTETFIDWLNAEYHKHPELWRPNSYGNTGNFIGDEINEDLHFLGYRCYSLHLIKDLVEFDYDQVTVSEDRFFNGKTYRELFEPHGNWWFKFLDWVVKERWEFAIFGFSY